jgi:Skp family chaperone for outer membrane proteins
MGLVRTLAIAILATVAGSTADVNAQEGESAGLVAVLDVARVFKENPEFDAAMKAIKQEADGLKAQIAQQQATIKEEAQQLAQYEAGSAERNQLEGTLEQKQAALRTQARQAEANLLNREAGIYFETYNQMQGVVGEIASQHGISLVLRFDSAEIDPSNRAEVIKGVNRPVVFHRRLDLTNLVIQNMGNATAKAGDTTQR